MLAGVGTRQAAVAIAVAGALAMPSAAAADGPAAYQADPGHTGAAAGTTFAAPLGKRWVRRDLSPNLSFPVIAEGKAFLTAGSSVYALSVATGATVWSRALRANGVAYDAGRVFAINADGVMQALSAADGTVLWTSRLPGASSEFSPPTAFGGFVYASSESTVFGVRQADGIVVWSKNASTDVTSIPAVDQDKTYTSRGCATTAIQRTVGVQVWGYAGGCSSYAGAAAVRNGLVYAVGARDGVVLDALTGTLRDSFAATMLPAFAGDTGYFVNGREVYARSDSTGLVLWRNTGESDIAAPPIVAGAYVYAIASGDYTGPKLVAIARASGEKVWESDLHGRSSSNYRSWPGIAATGDALVVSYGSRVVGYASGADTPGIDEPEKPPPLSEPMSLTAAPTDIVFGKRVTLQGELGSGSGAPIEIQADPWPFDDWEPLATVETSYGSFSLRVKPDRNTRYRAVYRGTFPTSESPEVTVYSDYRVAWRVIARSRRSVLVRLSAAGPLDLGLRGSRIYVYHVRARARSATRVGAIKLRGSGTHVRGRASMRTPKLRRTDLFFICRRELVDDGFGQPEPRLALCGRRRVR